MERYEIPCLHETMDLPESVQVSDYHPLALEELTTLLQIAQHSNRHVAFDIQGRIQQAVRGITCPEEEIGPEHPEVMRRMRVAAYFIGQKGHWTEPEVIWHLWCLLND